MLSQLVQKKKCIPKYSVSRDKSLLLQKLLMHSLLVPKKIKIPAAIYEVNSEKEFYFLVKTGFFSASICICLPVTLVQ